MSHILVMLLGAFGGAVSVVLILEGRRRAMREERQKLDAQATHLETSLARVSRQERELSQTLRRVESQVVTYDELKGENEILKRDLQNIDVSLRKTQLDRDLQKEEQDRLDQRGRELGGRYLKENIKWIRSSIGANNYRTCKEKLLKTVEWCRSVGLAISADEESGLIADLKAEYERAVRAALEREEQARIKAQIREEQKLEREVKRELERLERERQVIQAALEKALADTKDEHSAEIENLRRRLAEAEAKAQRAVAQAQLTKAGYVYVISNLGSFGENVFKIGMTRRLEPMDRVRELGDASVPFPFDVHMMVSCDDAPALENALHRALRGSRVNKVNFRKEYFATDIESIRRIVEANHGVVEYVVDPEALEYRQSLDMPEEDLNFIESVYERVEEDEEEGVLDVE